MRPLEPESRANEVLKDCQTCGTLVAFSTRGEGAPNSMKSHDSRHHIGCRGPGTGCVFPDPAVIEALNDPESVPCSCSLEKNSLLNDFSADVQAVGAHKVHTFRQFCGVSLLLEKWIRKNVFVTVHASPRQKNHFPFGTSAVANLGPSGSPVRLFFPGPPFVQAPKPETLLERFFQPDFDSITSRGSPGIKKTRCQNVLGNGFFHRAF